MFDLTSSTRFLFGIPMMQGNMILGVIVIDVNEQSSLGLVEGVVAGQLELPFNELMPMTFPGADLSLVDSIAFILMNEEGLEGCVVLGGFSTDGGIASGPVIPVDDEIFAEEVHGTYFNPNRDGEGCQSTLQRDQVNFILTCYFCDQGEQFWMIGTGTRTNQRVVFGDIVITSGAGFGSQFNPADVVKEPFGEVVVDFTDCNNFTATVNSQLPQFQDLVLDVPKLVPGACP